MAITPLLRMLAFAGWLVLASGCQAGVLLWVQVALNREGAPWCWCACKGALPRRWDPATATAAAAAC